MMGALRALVEAREGLRMVETALQAAEALGELLVRISLTPGVRSDVRTANGVHLVDQLRETAAVCREAVLLAERRAQVDVAWSPAELQSAVLVAVERDAGGRLLFVGARERVEYDERGSTHAHEVLVAECLACDEDRILSGLITTVECWVGL